MGTIRYTPNQSGIEQVLFSPNGITGAHVQQVANRVAASAKARVGVKSTDLRATIRAGPTPVRRGKGLTIEVVAGGDGVNYALWHHEGTRPHVIRPRNARVLRFQVGGATVFATRVNHPGTRPNRYLTDALRDAGL